MRRAGVVLLLVLLVAASGTAGGQARGEPLLRVSLPDAAVDPGETTTLALTVVNEGDPRQASTTNPSHTELVTTARGIRIELDAEDAPVAVETDERLVGGLQQGATTTAEFEIRVDEDAAPGLYEVPVALEYVYTKQVTREGITIDEETRVERTVTVRVSRTARFDVVDSEASVRGGESGRVSVTLENTGTAEVQEASVTVESPDAGLAFGDDGARLASRFAGTWEPGERRTFTYRVRAAESPTEETFSLGVRVDYRDRDGDRQQSRPLDFGVAATTTPTFAFEDLAATLRVDDRGSVTGTVVNAGPTPVRDVVVALESPTTGVAPRSSVRPVGDLGAGERAAFAFEVDVAPSVAPGVYQLSLRPAYTGAEGAPLSSDEERLQATISPEREPFAFAVLNGTVAPDTDNYRLRLAVTNVGEVPRRDVVLRLSLAAPFTSTTPAVHVPALAPGETTGVVLDLSVDEDAVPGSYPVTVNVSSDTDERDDVADGPYLVPVTVLEPPAGPTDLVVTAVAAVLVLVVLGIGWWWLRG